MEVKVATLIEISTQVGEYFPQPAVRRGVAKVGIIIRNRSSHMPSSTPGDAMVAVVMERSLRIPSSKNGMKKFTTTIPQNCGEKRPSTFTLKTLISLGSFP